MKSNKKLYFVRTRARLTQEEMMRAFSVSENDPLFCGVLDLIQDRIDDCARSFSLPDMANSHGSLAHYSGSMNDLLELRSDMVELRNRAVQGSPKAGAIKSTVAQHD